MIYLKYFGYFEPNLTKKHPAYKITRSSTKTGAMQTEKTYWHLQRQKRSKNFHFPRVFIACSGQLQLQDLLPFIPAGNVRRQKIAPVVLRGLFRDVVLEVLSWIRAPGFVAGNYYLQESGFHHFNYHEILVIYCKSGSDMNSVKLIQSLNSSCSQAQLYIYTAFFFFQF